MSVVIRPTVAEDLSSVIGEPLPYRIRALTLLDGDQVLGVGGVAFPPNAAPIAFVQQAVDIDDLRRRYKVSIHRIGLAAIAMIRSLGLREVMATADAGDAAALRWLARLGFERVAERGGAVIFKSILRPSAMPPGF